MGIIIMTEQKYTVYSRRAGKVHKLVLCSRCSVSGYYAHFPFVVYFRLLCGMAWFCVCRRLFIDGNEGRTFYGWLPYVSK